MDIKIFNKENHIDKLTGIRYNSIGINGRNVSHFYPSEFSTNPKSDKLIVNVMESRATANKYDTAFRIKHNCDFYLCDMDNAESRFIDTAEYYCGTACPNGFYYYTVKDKAYKINLETFEKQFICENPEGIDFYGVPSISRDGELMAVYWKDSDGKPRSGGLINTVTGEFKTVVTRKWVKEALPEPNDWIDHPLINPYDKDICFFCRNGDARIINDRLWTVNLKTGEYLNVYKQKKTPIDRKSVV